MRLAGAVATAEHAPLPAPVRPHLGPGELGWAGAGPMLKLEIGEEFRASSLLDPCNCRTFPNKIYLANEGNVYSMASAGACVKSRIFSDAPKEDDLVEGILKGVEELQSLQSNRFQEQRRAIYQGKSR